MILALIAGFFIGLGKSIADRTANKALWLKSLFRVFPENSYFGHKDGTWKRKHYYEGKNAFLHFLFKTILVMFTDIWHLGNSIYITSTWLTILGFIFIKDWTEYHLFILLISCIISYMSGFSLFYKVILYRKPLDKIKNKND